VLVRHADTVSQAKGCEGQQLQAPAHCITAARVGHPARGCLVYLPRPLLSLPVPLTSGPLDKSSTNITLSDTPAPAAQDAMSAATSGSRCHSTRQRTLPAAAAADAAAEDDDSRWLLLLWEEREVLGSNHTAWPACV
jgi:hypothetical protein